MKKLITIILALGFLALSGNVLAQTKVRVYMDWYPGVHYVPFVVAKEFGYYASEGLDVEIISGKGAAISAQAVAANAAQFGITGAINVLAAREQDMKIKAISGAYQNNSQSIFFRKASGIKTPQDLKGKSVVSDPKKSTHLQLLAFLKKAGLTEDQLKIVSVGGTLYAELSLFLSGQVDCVVGVLYIIKDEKQLLKDIEGVAWFSYSDYGLKLIDKVLITNEKTIEAHPELVAKFTKIYVKALEYAIQHPQQAVKILVKYYPQLNEELELSSLKESAKHVYGSEGGALGIGRMALADWKKTNDLLISAGQLTKGKKYQGAFTNDFIK